MSLTHTPLLAPLLALVGWTLCVLLTIPFRRFRAGFRGQVTPADFRYGESARVPGEVSLANRNYMNLLEAPLLFYVVGGLMLLTQRVDALALTLAWVYVGLRVLHSLVHLTYNNVVHRLTLFASSNLVLTLLWLRLVLALAH